MKRLKKLLSILVLILFTVGFVSMLETKNIDFKLSKLETKIQAYDYNPNNILDNVFEQDGLLILPFILDNTDQTISKTYVTNQFREQGLTPQISTTNIVTGTKIVASGKTYTVLIYGDINGDGKINVADVQKIIKHYLYEGKDELKGIYALAANVYNDNDKINVADANRIIKFYLGTETKLVLNQPKSIKEAQKPVITLKGANPQTINFGSSYIELGATAKDAYNKNVSVTINASKVNVNKVGTYTVTYNATDSRGNKATQVTRTVQVIDYITGIQVKSPTKLVYTQGENLDLTGATVKNIMASGASTTAEQIESAMISGYDSSILGEQTVTVTYSGKTATFNVKVYDPLTVDSIEVVGLEDEELRADNITPLDKTIKFKNYAGTELNNVVGSRIVKKSVPAGVEVTFLNSEGLDVSDSGVPNKKVTQIRLETTETENKSVTIVLTIDGKDCEIDINIGAPTKILDIEMAAEVTLYEKSKMPVDDKEGSIIQIPGEDFVYTLLDITIETNYASETTKLTANQINALTGTDVASENNLSYKDSLSLAKLGVPTQEQYTPSVLIKGFRWEEGTGIVAAENNEEIDFIGIADNSWDFEDLRNETITLTYITAEKTIVKTISMLLVDSSIIHDIEVVGLTDKELRADNITPLDKTIIFKDYAGDPLDNVVRSRIIEKIVPTGVEITFLNSSGLDVSDISVPDKIVTQIRLETTKVSDEETTIVLTIDGKDFEIEISIGKPAVANIQITDEVTLYEQMPGDNNGGRIQQEGIYIYTILDIVVESNYPTEPPIKLRADQIKKLAGTDVAMLNNLSYKDSLSLEKLKVTEESQYTPSVIIKGFRLEGGTIVPATGNEEIDFIGIAANTWEFEDLEDEEITLTYKTAEKDITITIDIKLDKTI